MKQQESLADVVAEFLDECRNGKHPSVDEDLFYRLKLTMHQESNGLKCDHSHYSFEKHGRICPCGTMMTDFGD